MGGFFKYVLAGAAAMRTPSASFVMPPAVPSVPGTSSLGRSTAYRLLVSSCVAVERDGEMPPRPNIETQTLHVPFGSFSQMENNAKVPTGETVIEFEEEHGLLCLERTVPDEVFRGLEDLVDQSAPFKVEVIRSQSNEDWLDTLATEPFLRNMVLTSSQHGDRNEQAHSASRLTGNLRNRAFLEPDVVEARETIRWLKVDVKRVTDVFDREISRLLALCPGAAFVGEGEEGSVDITVKLELLKKGKCPRFHLDKVPLRLICTYVGPSTEWLDGYDTWEMEHNRTFPPACNLKISGGREARQARAGDILIFRGQAEGLDALGVAHRSPDMVEGQRRLVLTVDVGNLISSSPR